MDNPFTMRLVDTFNIEGLLEARGLNRRMITYVIFLAVARLCYLEYDVELFNELYVAVPDLDKCVALAIKDRKVILYSNEIALNSTVIAVIYQAKALYLVLKADDDRFDYGNHEGATNFTESDKEYSWSER